ncbi:MAG TPA: hypothetical protein VHV51_03055 [Polyangiaceae bacterium]|nr:hypothetical protein [Polyangiaceae bacterium]
MKRLASIKRTALLGALTLSAIVGAGCTPKKTKPVHTEPWLAHPPASAEATPDAAIATTRYVVGERSVIRLELPTQRGKLRAKLTRVHGELQIALGALAQSRAQISAELGSLALDGDDDDSAGEWLARAQRALGITDGGASSALTSFEVTALDDVSPEAIAPTEPSDAGRSNTRRVRANADGDLLLNHFRVQKRAPLEAEFAFGADRAVPESVLIRSRGPLVVSLETHEIQLRDSEDARENRDKRRQKAAQSPHEVRVSVELYGTKE